MISLNWTDDWLIDMINILFENVLLWEIYFLFDLKFNSIVTYDFNELIRWLIDRHYKYLIWKCAVTRNLIIFK